MSSTVPKKRRRDNLGTMVKGEKRIVYQGREVVTKDGKIFYSGHEVTPISELANPVWDQQYDDELRLEADRWFYRFNIYRHLGTERTMMEAYRRYRKERGQPMVWKNGQPINRCQWTWICASIQWRWEERARAWDNTQLQKLDDVWFDRQLAVRESEWGTSLSLMQRADEMLQFPLARVEKTDTLSEDGRTVHRKVTIEPTRWTQRDIAVFAKTASHLARLASGMVDHTTQRSLNINIQDLTDDELDQIISGEDPVDVVSKSRS